MSEDDMGKRLLDAVAIAPILGISVWQVREWWRQGLLPCARIKGKRFMSRAQLDRWVAVNFPSDAGSNVECATVTLLPRVPRRKP